MLQMKPCPLKSIWMKGKWTPWAWSKQGRSVNCVTSEYEGDLHSNEHYLNSSEMKAWKKFRPLRDLNPWGEDCPHIHVFIRSSDIWLSYIQSRLFTTSWVYLEPTQWPAPSWLVSSVGRALHRYCRGHGFKSRTAKIRSYNIWLSYIRIYLCYQYTLYFWIVYRVLSFCGAMIISISKDDINKAKK